MDVYIKIRTMSSDEQFEVRAFASYLECKYVLGERKDVQTVVIERNKELDFVNAD